MSKHLNKGVLIKDNYIINGWTNSILNKDELNEIIETISSHIKYFEDNELSNDVVKKINKENKIKRNRERIDLFNHNQRNKPKPDLYLIQNVRTKNFKIGRSANVKSRLTILNLSSDDPLILIYAVKEKGFLESKMHEKFKHLRLNSEWFKYDEDIINAFKNEL